MLVWDFLRKDSQATVVFLAPTVALVDQVSRKFIHSGCFALFSLFSFSFCSISTLQQATVFKTHLRNAGFPFRVISLYGMGESDRCLYPGQLEELMHHPFVHGDAAKAEQQQRNYWNPKVCSYCFHDWFRFDLCFSLLSFAFLS